MNIFVTDENPLISAANLDDKRVVKMVLESAQLLSYCVWYYDTPWWETTQMYKPSHQNHPCAKWVLESSGNFKWLLRHFDALLTEYRARYGKTHASERLLIPFHSFLDNLDRTEPMTPFVNAASNMEQGVTFKHIQDVPLAYKLYLTERWKRDKRNPTWYKDPKRKPF